MEFWNLLMLPQNGIFAVSLMLMLGIGILEIISLMLGGINQWINGLLPDSLFDVDVDGIDGAEGMGVVTAFLSWLYVGKLPFLIVMILILTFFGLIGLGIQHLAQSVLGTPLSSWLAAPAAFLVSLPFVRASAYGLYRILPKDETTAINLKDLTGRVGLITTGTASEDRAVEVKVQDRHGQYHYVMMYSESGTIGSNQKVLLTKKLEHKEGSFFKGIPIQQ